MLTLKQVPGGWKLARWCFYGDVPECFSLTVENSAIHLCEHLSKGVQLFIKLNATNMHTTPIFIPDVFRAVSW